MIRERAAASNPAARSSPLAPAPLYYSQIRCNMRNRSGGFLTLFVLLTIFIIGNPQAAELPFASPQSVGMSSAKLRKIETVVGDMIDEQKLAGAVTLVLRQGQVVHLKAHGWQDIDTRTPMREDAIFRIYSMTKAIVSTGVMMLHEEGRFDLDDAVSKHIPELARVQVASEAGLVLQNA